MDSALVGMDRSKSSRRAAEFALQRAQLNQWRVVLVHVINWSRYSITTLQENEVRPATRRAEIEHAQSTILEPALARARKKGYLESITVETRVHHGKPSEVLAELAAREKHDIVVVGRTGDANLKTAIFGSTANRLVQHAPCPVVVVP